MVTLLVTRLRFRPGPGRFTNGKTTFTSTSVFDSVEDRDWMLESGMESGTGETMDRLDECLEVLKGRAAG